MECIVNYLREVYIIHSCAIYRYSKPSLRSESCIFTVLSSKLMLHNLEPVIRNRNSTNPHRIFQATVLLRQSFIWEEKPNLQKEIPPAVFTGFYLAQTFFFWRGEEDREAWEKESERGRVREEDVTHKLIYNVTPKRTL